MRAVFTLTSAESRRLIAKAAIQMPEFQAAWTNAYVLLTGGTTNAFIAQELLGRDDILPARCTVGLNTDGLLCVTAPDSRQSVPTVFDCGQAVDKTLSEALADLRPETVVIKGANAVDAQGNVGILTAAPDGGTVARILGPVTSQGLRLIVPVGLEKLVPSVPAAEKALGGASKIDLSMGAAPGMYCLSNATVVTEVEAIRLLFHCEATLVCCGGVGGSEGAVTLAVDGEEAQITALVTYLEDHIKGEPPVAGNRGVCETCTSRSCRYRGKKAQDLPQWMKRKP
jgi:hypothetical protein